MPDAIIRLFGEGETVTDHPERTIRILCDHELLALTWTRYEPGERGPDPHVHHRHVDTFFVLEGELVFGLGPDVEQVRAPAGTFVAAPPNLVHTFANESDGPSFFFLNLHAPSTGFADNLRGRGSFDSHDPPDEAAGPSPTASSPAGTGRALRERGAVRWVKAELTELSVLELEVEPGWTVPAHHHDDHLDSFYVLGGDVELATGNGPVGGIDRDADRGPSGHGARHPQHRGGTRMAAEHARAGRGLRGAQPLAALREPSASLEVVEDDAPLAALEHEVEVAAADGVLGPPAVDDAPLLPHEHHRAAVHPPRRPVEAGLDERRLRRVQSRGTRSARRSGIRDHGATSTTVHTAPDPALARA